MDNFDLKNNLIIQKTVLTNCEYDIVKCFLDKNVVEHIFCNIIENKTEHSQIDRIVLHALERHKDLLPTEKPGHLFIMECLENKDHKIVIHRNETDKKKSINIYLERKITKMDDLGITTIEAVEPKFNIFHYSIVKNNNGDFSILIKQNSIVILRMSCFREYETNEHISFFIFENYVDDKKIIEKYENRYILIESLYEMLKGSQRKYNEYNSINEIIYKFKHIIVLKNNETLLKSLILKDVNNYDTTFVMFVDIPLKNFNKVYFEELMYFILPNGYNSVRDNYVKIMAGRKNVILFHKRKREEIWNVVNITDMYIKKFGNKNISDEELISWFLLNRKNWNICICEIIEHLYQ